MKLNVFVLGCVGILFFLGACDRGEGQKMFYWERPNTGAVWFAKDHRECMEQNDSWPFEMPGMPWGWGKPKLLELKFDNNSDHGVWAQFIPYPGAMPVHVNYVEEDWSVNYDDYQTCMEQRGYAHRIPARVGPRVFPL